MSNSNRIHIPFTAAITMIWNYARCKINEQVRAIAFIIIYLTAFKIIVLNSPPEKALQLSIGIGMVAFGLAFFLEGLFLGLMPIGERVGIQLPLRFNIFFILVFGLLLGFGATLAEPAIASLRVAGMSVNPWDTPLLFRIFEVETEKLVMAIGAGVGVAVAFGLARFYWGFSLKPFLYFLVPVLLAVSAIFAQDENLRQILNLAWDTGGVTTGPVTVPLVLAMGIGISRSSGKIENRISGFGVVTLASLFPVLGVLILGGYLNQTTPAPVPVAKFFSSANRENALKLLKSETGLKQAAFQRGDEKARRAFFNDEKHYEEALKTLVDPEKREELLGSLTLEEWLSRNASSKERASIALVRVGRKLVKENVNISLTEVLEREGESAFKAVIPLIALLVFVLIALLRDRPKHVDEVVLGVIFALAGMTILTSGIKLGIAPLGDQVGRPLPQVFRSETYEEGRIILEPFDLDSVKLAYGTDGTLSRYFYLKDRSGALRLVPFEESRYDKEARRYEYIVERPPLFGPELTLVGIALVFLFAFGMGYGSTVAEPALNAFGSTVEELTVGTVKKSGVINTVSLGVGLGLLAGIARILYDIPMTWLLLPSYTILLVLTWFSDDEFVGIAWDSGGVTTGPITVPLVLSMGLGIGGELKVIDGFGIVAMASVFPILTMLIYGIRVRMKQRLILVANGGENNGEE